MNNSENNEIKVDFGERLKFIAWMEFKGVRAFNTTYAGGDSIIVKGGKHASVGFARPKVSPDGTIAAN